MAIQKFLTRYGAGWCEVSEIEAEWMNAKDSNVIIVVSEPKRVAHLPVIPFD